MPWGYKLELELNTNKGENIYLHFYNQGKSENHHKSSSDKMSRELEKRDL